METTLLELRQSNSLNVSANGDYTNIMLQNSVFLNEGDEVSVKNAFIDTSLNKNNSIIIDDDIDISFKFGVYNTNWDVTGKTYTDVAAADCQKYVLCKKSATNIPENGELIIEINFGINFVGMYPIPFSNWGGFQIRCQFKDLNGVVRFINYEVPTVNYDPYDHDTESQTLLIDLLCEEGSFSIVSPTTSDMNLIYYTQIVSIGSEPISGNAFNYTPVILEKNISIKANSYNATFFAKMITDLLTKNDYDSQNNGTRYYPSKNAFLFSSNDLDPTYHFVNSETLDNSFIYPNVPATDNIGAFWIGSSQVSLVFDENSSRFSFEAIHMPLYDSTSGSMVIKFIANPTPESSFSVPVQQNSGIYWNSITSSNPKYTNLFETLLNFNFSTITPSYTNQLINLNEEPSFVPRFKWTPQNHTGGLSTIDVGVLKVGDATRLPDSANMQTTITEYQSIYSESLFSKVNNSGFFKIQVEGIYHNQLLSDDYKQVNIASIVSRYYENNNYCNGSQADSVVYIHKGASQSINNFRVRILDSTNKLASDIGSDNTIYIQINKQINKVLPVIEDNKVKSKK